MTKLDEIRNEVKNLGTDTRKALLVELLRAEENRTLNSMIPLEADHKAALKKEEDDRVAAFVIAAAVGAALISTCVILAVKGKRKLEEEAHKAKEQLEKEKKDMIRRLSAVKGRH